MVLRIAYSDKKEDYICCIFQPAFGCCAPQALVKICNMNVFNGKMLKKGEKSKNLVIISLHCVIDPRYCLSIKPNGENSMLTIIVTSN